MDKGSADVELVNVLEEMSEAVVIRSELRWRHHREELPANCPYFPLMSQFVCNWHFASMFSLDAFSPGCPQHGQETL